MILDGTEFRTFPSQIRRKGISNQLRGLLEVEPLHFTCCSASEATRIENMDSVASIQANNAAEDIIFETSSQMEGASMGLGNTIIHQLNTEIMGTGDHATAPGKVKVHI